MFFRFWFILGSQWVSIADATDYEESPMAGVIDNVFDPSVSIAP